MTPTSPAGDEEFTDVQLVAWERYCENNNPMLWLLIRQLRERTAERDYAMSQRNYLLRWIRQKATT